MSIAYNDVTGDLLKSKKATDAYREGWDRIFAKKAEVVDDAIVKIQLLQEEQQALADGERLLWWNWVQKHQATLERVPTFEEWRAEHLSR